MTQGRKLRVGIVGTGMVGSIHARSARLAGARLVGVSAATPASGEEAAARLGAERAFADARSLVESPELDVVHICTPNDLHLELAAAVIAAGKHVVCEKPLAISLADARELQRAAAAAEVIASVPFVYRFYPMVREARARVLDGELGRIGLIGGAYLQDWLLPQGSSDWRMDGERGGPSRAFADIGSHWCDLVEFAAGMRIAALSAQMRTFHPGRPTEDVAVVSFRTVEEAAGAVLVSQVSAGHKNDLNFELTGERGTIRFEQQAPDSLLIGRQGSTTILERERHHLRAEASRYSTLPGGHPQGYHDCFEAFVADTYASIAAGSPVEGLPTFVDGVRSVALTEAALQSAAADGAWTEVEALSSIQ